MIKRRFILILVVGSAVIAAATAFLRRSAPPSFLETKDTRYRVISAQYIGGTNLTLPREGTMAALKRRLCDVVGVSVAGFRTNWAADYSVRRHAFCFLCEGQYPTNDAITQIMLRTDADCVDDTGRSIRFMGVSSINRNDDRFWVVWSMPGIHETNQFPYTDFNPREFRLSRKSDGHELVRVTVPR